MLVFRHPETFRAVFYCGTDDLLFAVKMVHDGTGPAEASRLSGLTEETVAGFMERASQIGLAILP